VQAEELFLWVPRKMLMTVESSQNSVLGENEKPIGVWRMD